MVKLDELIPNKSLFSDHYLTIAIFSGTFVLSYVLIKFNNAKKQSNRNFPPCLKSVPLLGSLPYLPEFGEMADFFMKKAKEHGPIFSVAFGSRNAVILNGRSAICEAFLRHSLAFASRPVFFVAEYMQQRGKGIIQRVYSKDLKKYQQLCLNILKKFGFGQNIMERRIHVEVDAFVAQVRQRNGSEFDPNHLITGSVLNVIASIILGERYEYSSPTLERLIKDAHKMVRISDLGVLNLFPILRFIPKYREKVEVFRELQNGILRFMEEKVDAALRNELPESFITHYIEIEGADFDREQLLFTLHDLYLAGTETSSNTLLWAISLMANHPDIQHRLQEEIDSVVSRDRLPSLDDKRHLPFVDCTILEVMRLKTIVPLGLSHETIQDVDLNGFFIPSGTMVFSNLMSAHMDEKVWIEPATFNPDRFLDASGNLVKREEVIPFSVGKRSCLGELLAQQEIFLFFTGILQNFQILPPEGQEKVEVKEMLNFTMTPSNYKVRLLPRSK